MAGIFDIMNEIGAHDVSESTTGVAFDLLDPNNPVYVLALPGIGEPITLRGKAPRTVKNPESFETHKSFKEILKGLGIQVKVEIETGDEDDPSNQVKINFEKMSDFRRAEIIKKIKALNVLQKKTALVQTLVRKVQKDKKFQAMLSDPEKKESFLAYLEMQMEKLER